MIQYLIIVSLIFLSFIDHSNTINCEFQRTIPSTSFSYFDQFARKLNSIDADGLPWWPTTDSRRVCCGGNLVRNEMFDSFFEVTNASDYHQCACSDGASPDGSCFTMGIRLISASTPTFDFFLNLTWIEHIFVAPWVSLTETFPPTRVLEELSELKTIGIRDVRIPLNWNSSNIETHMKNLTGLILADLTMTQTLPTEIWNLEKLNVFGLINVMPRVTLPSGISNFSTLKYLVLPNSTNGLDLNFLENVTSTLRRIILRDNPINSAIPDSFNNLTQLDMLDLMNCGLYGTLPSQILSSTAFTEINLSNNNLSGILPYLGSKVPGTINISRNSFSGTIPKGFFDTGNLQGELDARFNYFSSIESGISPTGNLPYPMDLSNNNFTVFPNSLIMNSTFQSEILKMNFNFLTSIPDELFSGLYIQLEFKNNRISRLSTTARIIPGRLYLDNSPITNSQGKPPLWISSIVLLSMRNCSLQWNMTDYIFSNYGGGTFDLSNNNLSGIFTIPASDLIIQSYNISNNPNLHGVIDCSRFAPGKLDKTNTQVYCVGDTATIPTLQTRTNSNNNNNNNNGENNLNDSSSVTSFVGLIVGIVVGIFVLIICIGFLILLLILRKRKRNRDEKRRQNTLNAELESTTSTKREDNEKEKDPTYVSIATKAQKVENEEPIYYGSKQESNTTSNNSNSSLSTTKSKEEIESEQNAKQISDKILKYLIPIEELEFSKKIGSGNFGEVWKGEWRGSDVAIKKLIVSDESIALKEFVLELSVMLTMRPHENVVMLKGYCSEPRCIVTQFLDGGDLKTYLETKKEEAPIEQLVHFCEGIARGLLHLHEEGIVHRDLASRNILISENGEKFDPIISDFGLSRDITSVDDETYISNASNFPLKWLSPEAVRSRKFTKKSDVWAFGCTIVEIFDSGKLYPNETNRTKVADQVQKGLLIPSVPIRAPKFISRMLIESCFIFDSEKRADMVQICHELQATKLQ